MNNKMLPGLLLLAGLLRPAAAADLDPNQTDPDAILQNLKASLSIKIVPVAGGLEAKDVPPDAQHVFITSHLYGGNLGGLSGADDKCQADAAAAGLLGSWRAILSDSDTDAKNRLAITGPVFNMNGSPGKENLIAQNAAEFWNGRLQGFIAWDEYRRPLDPQGDPTVWTGTAPAGSKASPFINDDCWRWSVDGRTGVAGYSHATDGTWADAGQFFCQTPKHLYCIDRQSEAPPHLIVTDIRLGNAPGQSPKWLYISYKNIGEGIGRGDFLFKLSTSKAEDDGNPDLRFQVPLPGEERTTGGFNPVKWLGLHSGDTADITAQIDWERRVKQPNRDGDTLTKRITIP